MADTDEHARGRTLAALTMAMAAVALAHARSPDPVPAAPTHVARPAPAARALREGERVDLNRADEPTLELLPGIGPALAQRIVTSRTEEGAFHDLEELARVRGIGARRIEALRPLVEVSAPRSGANRPPDSGVQP